MDLIRCNLGFGLLVWVLGFIGLIQFQFQTHKLELAQVRYFLFSTTATISPVVKWFYYIEKNGCRLLGFQASLLKLLPEVLLTILIGVLSEAGSSENFGLPQCPRLNLIFDVKAFFSPKKFPVALPLVQLDTVDRKVAP